jgi:hypothetical protein
VCIAAEEKRAGKKWLVSIYRQATAYTTHLNDSLHRRPRQGNGWRRPNTVQQPPRQRPGGGSHTTRNGQNRYVRYRDEACDRSDVLRRRRDGRDERRSCAVARPATAARHRRICPPTLSARCFRLLVAAAYSAVARAGCRSRAGRRRRTRLSRPSSTLAHTRNLVWSSSLRHSVVLARVIPAYAVVARGPCAVASNLPPSAVIRTNHGKAREAGKVTWDPSWRGNRDLPRVQGNVRMT